MKGYMYTRKGIGYFIILCVQHFLLEILDIQSCIILVGYCRSSSIYRINLSDEEAKNFVP